MPLWISIICIVAAVVIGAGAGIFLGIAIRKNTAEKEIGSAEEEAKKIVADAIKTAEARKKEVVLEGKDEVHRFRNESEKEISDRRKEVQRQERRIQQKEETLDKKLDNMERKEEKVNKKLRDADAKLEEVETLKKSQFEMLEKISGYTAEQAKSYLLSQLENELAHEKSVKIMEYTEQLKEEADDKARNIISLAIQRLAAEQVSEATISVVPLPNEEMKGRELYVFIEGQVEDDNAYVGRTYRDAPDIDGYIFINTDETLMTGDIVKVKVTGAYEYDLIGEICQ